MTILARLEEWKEQGVVSPEQHALLAGLARREPFSLFLELHILLYAGILAFVAGLGPLGVVLDRFIRTSPRVRSLNFRFADIIHSECRSGHFREWPRFPSSWLETGFSVGLPQ
jgi:hypothetical protein